MSIFELFAQTYPRLLQGLWMTIELTLVQGLLFYGEFHVYTLILSVVHH